MSIKAMMHVWQHSRQRGSALVVMLALADMANDDGECYPGKAKLSVKCRLTIRNLTLTLKKLEEAGELSITQRRVGNFQQSNVYKILLGGSDPQIRGVVIPGSGGDDPQIRGVVIPRSPDPLFKHQLTTSEAEKPTPRPNLILKSLQERQR